MFMVREKVPEFLPVIEVRLLIGLVISNTIEHGYSSVFCVKKSVEHTNKWGYTCAMAD